MLRRFRGPGSLNLKPSSLPLDSSRSLRLFVSSALQSSSNPALRQGVPNLGFPCPLPAASCGSCCGCGHIRWLCPDVVVSRSSLGCHVLVYAVCVAPILPFCRCVLVLVLANTHRRACWFRSSYCGRMPAGFWTQRTRRVLCRTQPCVHYIEYVAATPFCFDRLRPLRPEMASPPSCSHWVFHSGVFFLWFWLVFFHRFFICNVWPCSSAPCDCTVHCSCSAAASLGRHCSHSHFLSCPRIWFQLRSVCVTLGSMFVSMPTAGPHWTPGVLMVGFLTFHLLCVPLLCSHTVNAGTRLHEA